MNAADQDDNHHLRHSFFRTGGIYVKQENLNQIQP